MASLQRRVRKWLFDRAFYHKARHRRERPRAVRRSLKLHGKQAVVLGVATDQSIAWKIAKTLNDNGCRVALGFQERAGDYVRELARELHQPLLGQCELTDDDQIAAFFQTVAAEFGQFDFLIHSVAFAKKQFLEGKYFEIDRSGFSTAQAVSTFSLPAVVKCAQVLLNDNGRIITMSYLGANRAVPNYNIMGVCKAALEASVRYLAVDLGERGITVNAISAGPVKTLAASAIDGFDRILEVVAQRAPLKRNIAAQDVADLTLFLCSDLSRSITGQVLYVDAGYSAVGI